MGLFKALKSIAATVADGVLPSSSVKWQNTEPPEGLALLIGGSTGQLSAKGHPSGIFPNQFVWLQGDDCCLNIMAIGGIGAGKTTRIINPLLFQFMYYQDVGGLIFDIKGDFKESVYRFSAEANHNRVVTIGVGQRRINLLKGLTPEQAASFLQSTFMLTGGSTGDFWMQSATDLCRNALGLLQGLGDRYYTLEYLFQYIFIEDVRAALDEEIMEMIENLNPMSREGRLLKAYKTYYSSVFEHLDVKMKESIKGTLSVVLSPFQNPDLIDTFSDNDYEMTDILNGDVVLVDLPLALWGIGGKVVYTFIKLRFFNLLQMRQADKSMSQNYVFFMCDEYQDIISASRQGLSDLSFWDKSRSARCVGIVSTQSVNSFRSAIGNPTLADTIMANFRQKIFFRTEDAATIRMMNEIAGKVEIQRESTSYGNNSNASNLDFIRRNEGSNVSISTQIVERQLVDANLVRQLDANHVIALLNVEGAAADDILLVEPKYLS